MGIVDWPPALVSLVFLGGRWTGVGVGTDPATGADFRFRQQVDFAVEDNAGVVGYRSRIEPEDETSPALVESGYFRVVGPGQVEAIVTTGDGVAEIYVGRVTATRVELSTDVVARSPGAPEVAAVHRLYGLVEGELMYAEDAAVGGRPLGPWRSARLARRADGD